MIRLALVLLMLAGAAHAVLPSEQLADPALEARAREISLGLRCQVCQNQSIDDSNAPLAADLRRAVRERLSAGDSDEAVVAYVVQRYGDYVLMRPPLRWGTALLWFGPALVLLAGATGAILHLRRRKVAPETTPLDAAEEARLARLIKDPP